MGSLFGGGKKEEPRPEPQAPSVPIQDSTDDPSRTKKVGRTNLISSSSRGVLGNANTTSKKLSV